MTEINRYTYEISQIDGFQNLLDYWDKQQIYPPIFVEWHPHQMGMSATFRLETDQYRACITLHGQTAREIDEAVKQEHRKHRFIDVNACEDHADHDDLPI